MKAALVVLLAMVACVPNVLGQDYPWGWECRNETVAENLDATLDHRCVRVLKSNSTSASGLNTCKLTCGSSGALWPLPKSVTITKDVKFFIIDNFSHTNNGPASATGLLENATVIFIANLDNYYPVNGGDALGEALTHKVELTVNVVENHTHINYETNESYNLTIATAGDTTTVTIHAATFYGARHGLETLSQLIDFDDEHQSLQIVSAATITDEPTFKHRGISLDTSRNYVGVGYIKKTIDGMAANKLNILHWHITDSHSFPLVLPSLPNMTQYGAYTPSKIYTRDDVIDLIQYAEVRGVHIIPEFDAPAHVGNGFQWGEEEGLGKLAVCVEQEPWQSVCVEPPCGQLNLANEEMYNVLQHIYNDMADMFQPMHVFHYGGDEVNLDCWNNTDEIKSWMEDHGHGLDADAYYQQWSVFQDHARDRLINATVTAEDTAASSIGDYGILWTSHLTEEGNVRRYLNPDHYIIQIWTEYNSNIIKEVLEADFRVIFSNYDAWYLDCGFGAWVGDGPPNLNWCSPYKGWQTVYDNSPHQIARDLTGGDAYVDKIFGGEVAMWTEQTDEMALDSRLWPRSAAFAERMWSNPSGSWRLAETRMVHQRQRLVQRGIQADRLQPEWCHQNEGLCYAYPAPVADGANNLATMFIINVAAMVFILFNANM